MGTQPPEGGDKSQAGDPHNPNSNNPTNNNNSTGNYKDAITPTEPSTPGKKKSSFEGDFIIISEFSEQVGPVPIDVIPDWSHAGTFDLNTFVLKIMAVDFQNKSNDPQSYLKDSQVAMPEPGEDAYTYLHHFNLLDVYARGYVRPMCISYITHDRDKIMDYFQEIMAKVSKVTRTMKRGNHRLFLRDLEDRMADVRHTQAVMNSGQDLDTISPTPVTVNEYLADLEVMHQKFHRAVTLKQQRRAAREGNTSTKGSPHSMHSQSSHRHTPQPDEDEDDFEDEEEDEGKHEGGKDEGRRREGMPIEKSLNKAVAELSREYQPQVIQSLHPRTLHGKSLRNLQGLCDGNLQKAMSLINSLHRHYSRPCTVLALDAFDTPSLAPASSLLTIGQSVMLNFNLDMDKFMNKVITYEAERALSSGNIAALVYGTNSTQTVTSNNSSSVDDDSSSYGSARSMGSATSSPTEEQYVDEAMLVNGITGGPTETAHNGARVPPAPGLAALEHEENISPDPSSPLSAEEKHTPKPKHSIIPSFFSANLWPPLGLQQDFPGKGLMELRGKFVWLRHVIYSILRGRPVIVWGSAQNESAVRGIVQALSILVAGNNAGIVPWRTKPLKMSDLASFKLAGLVRTCQIAKAVEKYVTILDLENESLKSPPYPAQGRLIDEILALKKQWPDELSYLSHVHYVLFDAGVKSCLYYHVCCVTVHQLTPQQATQAHAYAHNSSGHYSPHPHSTSSHTHSHTHHSGHYHTYHPFTAHSAAHHQPPPLLRSHSTNPNARPTHHLPPSPRPSLTPSPHKPPSQPPSPRPSQPPSPHRSQPPSPRQYQNPSLNQAPQHTQPPPHSFVPLHPTAPSTEPNVEVRPEPVRLDMSQEIAPPSPNTEGDAKTDPPITELKMDLPVEAKTEPRTDEKTEPVRTRSDSKNNSTRPRKGTVNALQMQAPVRSQSMGNIGEKYRHNISSNPSSANTSNATSPNASVNSINLTNVNINSSTSSLHNTAKPGEEWRNSSSPSPSSSRHASWQYNGKAYASQGYRSLSDSQISPIWLPASPANKEKTRAQFFQQFEVPNGDTDIVMYLAEVVKEQQATEVQGTETPVIRLDYSSCQIFHSRVTKESSQRRG